MNEGIRVSGGSLQVGVMAVGRNARVENCWTEGLSSADGLSGDAVDVQSVLLLLTKLSERIEAERDHLSDAREALETVTGLRAELEQENPEEEQVRGLMARLIELVRPVGELVALTATVGNALRSLPFLQG
jgi:hypothetical protein